MKRRPPAHVEPPYMARRAAAFAGMRRPKPGTAAAELEIVATLYRAAYCLDAPGLLPTGAAVAASIATPPWPGFVSRGRA